MHLTVHCVVIAVMFATVVKGAALLPTAILAAIPHLPLYDLHGAAGGLGECFLVPLCWKK